MEATFPLPSPEVCSGTTELTARRMARRERIVNAAMSLALQGYDACQIRTVAATAGMSASTVYQYFPSKDDLLLACFYEWLWDFETDYRCGTTDTDPFQRLLQVSLALTGRLCSSPRFAEAMIRPYLYADGTAATQADMCDGRPFGSLFVPSEVRIRQRGRSALPKSSPTSGCPMSPHSLSSASRWRTCQSGSPVPSAS